MHAGRVIELLGQVVEHAVVITAGNNLGKPFVEINAIALDQRHEVDVGAFFGIRTKRSGALENGFKDIGCRATGNHHRQFARVGRTVHDLDDQDRYPGWPLQRIPRE